MSVGSKKSPLSLGIEFLLCAIGGHRPDSDFRISSNPISKAVLGFSDQCYGSGIAIII